MKKAKMPAPRGAKKAARRPAIKIDIKSAKAGSKEAREWEREAEKHGFTGAKFDGAASLEPRGGEAGNHASLRSRFNPLAASVFTRGSTGLNGVLARPMEIKEAFFRRPFHFAFLFTCESRGPRSEACSRADPRPAVRARQAS